VLVVILAVFFTVPMMGCEANRNFTNEEHIARISERVRERFFSEGSEHLHTDFAVTILYSMAGNPMFFMVEFEPNGFFYGRIHRNRYYVNWMNNYLGSNWEHGGASIGGVGQGGWALEDLESGRVELVFRSHFYILKMTNETRKYIGVFGVEGRHGFLLPMVRRGDIFISLLDGSEKTCGAETLSRISSRARGNRL